MADFAGPWRTSPARPPLTTHKSRRHYGGPLARTPRAGDGRRVPAGLLARGSGASPPPSRRGTGSGFWGDACRLQLRGQPRLGGPYGQGTDLAPRSLFTAATGQGRNETVTQARIEATPMHHCQYKEALLRSFSWAC